MKSSRTPKFAICVRNEGCEVSLERRKVYEVVPDPASARYHLLRVIDESGEGYLYPEDFFLPIALPKPVEKALSAAS